MRFLHERVRPDAIECIAARHLVDERTEPA